jgi:hypothetical protein
VYLFRKLSEETQEMNDSFEKCAHCGTWINVDTTKHYVGVNHGRTVVLCPYPCSTLYAERHDVQNMEVVRHPTRHTWRRACA